jgi:hypothetical protein
MTRHALALFLLGTLAAPSLAQIPQHQIDGREQKLLVVRVFDISSGDVLPNVPVQLQDPNRLAVTDSEGIALLDYWGSIDPEEKSVRAQMPDYTTGSIDFTVDGAVEATFIKLAPQGMFSTPPIDAGIGGVYTLSAQNGTPMEGAEDFWMRVSVPGGALPANGSIRITPLPWSSLNPSGGHTFGTDGTLGQTPLSAFSAQLVDSRGVVVADPQFNLPISFTLKPWIAKPVGDWADVSAAHVQLHHYNAIAGEWEGVKPEADGLDPALKEYTFTVDHFSKWAQISSESDYWYAIAKETGIPTNWGGGDSPADHDAKRKRWICGGPNATLPPPSLDTNTTCQDAGSPATIDCGKFNQNATASCTNEGSVFISQETLNSISTEIEGATPGALKLLFGGAKAKVGGTVSETTSGGLSVSSSLSFGQSVPAGGLVTPGIPAHQCLSGIAQARVKYENFSIQGKNSSGIDVTVPLPELRQCIEVGFVYDVNYDPTNCEHYDSAMGLEDCVDPGSRPRDTFSGCE